MENQELVDLMSESGSLTLNSICNQYDVHVNKAKSILDKFSKENKNINVIYYLSGVKDDKIIVSLIKAKDLKSKTKKFEKIFSIHIYAVMNSDFNEEKLTVSPISSEYGIHEINIPKKTSIKLPRTTREEADGGIFKKRAPVKKGVAKAFANMEPKTENNKQTSKEIKKEAKTDTNKTKQTKTETNKTKPKPNSKVSSFFDKSKKETAKSTKKIKNQDEKDDEDEDELMDVDDEPKKKLKKEPSPSPPKRKVKNEKKEAKPKRRRVQVDSSSDEEEEQTEAHKLLFGDDEEKRLRNISIEEDEPKILAENTILSSEESEHEGHDENYSEDEKENKPKKKPKTSFGTAKIIGDGKATKKVKKTRYHVDDEGNMVSEQYFEEEEIGEDELQSMQEKDRIEKEKKIEKIRKLTPEKPAKAKSTKANAKANMKQKSISSFFTKKK